MAMRHIRDDDICICSLDAVESVLVALMSGTNVNCMYARCIWTAGVRRIALHLAVDFDIVELLANTLEHKLRTHGASWINDSRRFHIATLWNFDRKSYCRIACHLRRVRLTWLSVSIFTFELENETCWSFPRCERHMAHQTDEQIILRILDYSPLYVAII